jgi:Uma2 family endonuclease
MVVGGENWMTTLSTNRVRTVPARVLAALRRAGATEEEIRCYYEIPTDEPLPEYTGERLRVEDMALLPEDSYRYELWEGTLVRRMASKPRHGSVAGRIVRRLSVYLDQHPLGEIYIAEAGFHAGPGESLYCPDASYVSNERIATMTLDEFAPFAPDIAIEVRSPDNTMRKLETKARHYLAHGGRRVWILRPQDRTVCVYRPDAPRQVLAADDLLTAEELLPGFAVRVGDLFPG